MGNQIPPGLGGGVKEGKAGGVNVGGKGVDDGMMGWGVSVGLGDLVRDMMRD